MAFQIIDGDQVLNAVEIESVVEVPVEVATAIGRLYFGF